MPYQPFQPLNDLVLVRRFEEDNSTTKGGLVIAEKYRQQSNRGIVVNYCPYFIGEPFQVGDRVTFGIYNAETINVEGEELLLIRANDIRGVERHFED